MENTTESPFLVKIGDVTANADPLNRMDVLCRTLKLIDDLSANDLETISVTAINKLKAKLQKAIVNEAHDIAEGVEK